MEFEISNMPVTLSDVSSYLKGYPPSVDGDYTLVIAVFFRNLFHTVGNNEIAHICHAGTKQFQIFFV